MCCLNMLLFCCLIFFSGFCSLASSSVVVVVIATERGGLLHPPRQQQTPNTRKDNNLPLKEMMKRLTLLSPVSLKRTPPLTAIPERRRRVARLLQGQAAASRTFSSTGHEQQHANPLKQLKQVVEDLRELGARGRLTSSSDGDEQHQRSPQLEVEETTTPVPMFTARTLPDGMTLLVMAVSGDGRALEVSMPTLVPPRTYVYSERMKSWVCTHDSHDMLGMITREMMPRVSGLPAWAFR